ncbi:hypothetical protein ACFXGI_06825 [Streptomyces sp. NPDC059355]|uniref:hypothetical protein n=1 Tax=Streptomyces sp. NPDC059355 TaxID=3346811 RepID=UPI0036A913B4
MRRTDLLGGAGDAQLVHDVLWAHARPHHALEHITARTAPHGIDLVVFVRAETPAVAQERVASLLNRTLAPLGGLGYAPDLATG